MQSIVLTFVSLQGAIQDVPLSNARHMYIHIVFCDQASIQTLARFGASASNVLRTGSEAATILLSISSLPST